MDARTLHALANTRFWGPMSQGAVAGQYAAVQLANPAASGVLAILDYVDGAAATGVLGWANYDTLLTDVGTQPNAYIGGPVSACHLRRGSTASIVGTALIQSAILANTPYQPRLTAPIIIPPGKAVICQFQTVNVSLQATFGWREVAG